VQVNGKLRDTFQAVRDVDSDSLISVAMESDKIRAYVEGQTIVKTIVVPNKIVNIVVR
jgi:leucyl-tRNA synthetase